MNTLHGYYRSTAAWRVRIALGLKGLPTQQVPHHLRRGEHRAPGFLALNPQGLLPVFETDAGGGEAGPAVLTQSLAIIEYLDEIHPDPPLLPATSLARARVRAFALAIACDIHPVQNLRVLARLRALGLAEPQVQAWAHDTIAEGLDACEALLAGQPGPYCFGDAPGLADLCLAPQLFNARRFAVPLDGLARLLRAEAACLALPAFADAVAERQPDAE